MKDLSGAQNDVESCDERKKSSWYEKLYELGHNHGSRQNGRNCWRMYLSRLCNVGDNDCLGESLKLSVDEDVEVRNVFLMVCDRGESWNTKKVSVRDVRKF